MHRLVLSEKDAKYFSIARRRPVKNSLKKKIGIAHQGCWQNNARYQL
jgi:hypothetical protein